MTDGIKKGAEEKEYEDATLGKNYQKERLFYRGLTGFTYSLREELKRLRKVPEVIKGKDLQLKKGPQYFNVDILTPKEKITPGPLCPLRGALPGRKVGQARPYE